MKQLLKRFNKFQKDFPEVAKAYEELGTAVHKSGPFYEKTPFIIQACNLNRSGNGRCSSLGYKEGVRRRMYIR